MSEPLASGLDQLSIVNGRVVTADRVIDDGYVRVDGDTIAAVGRCPAPDAGRTVDASGQLVLPGFVDLHGDDLERHRFPRPEASIDVETALQTCDRANVAAGITTKFHAVAFENAPDENRTVAQARAVTERLDSGDGLLADTRVNARCELGEDRAVEAVRGILDRDVVDIVSLMNHVPSRGQFGDAGQFERRYTDGGRSATDTADRIRQQRGRVSPGTIDEATWRVLDSARDAGVTVASHDDETPARVDAMAARGVSICEFPVTMAAAHRATDRGLATAMGAPNLVRGGSLWGNLSARAAIRERRLDVLCTDYHPGSLLEAVFVQTGEALPERVRRVSAAPARAVGLDDRGRIERGARADLLLVEPASPPRVRCAFVAGDLVDWTRCPATVTPE